MWPKLFPGQWTVIKVRRDTWFSAIEMMRKSSIAQALKEDPNSGVKAKVKLLSRVWLFVTPQTVAHQPPPPMEFSRQEYWSGLPFPSPGDLPDPGIEPRYPALQARHFTIWATMEVLRKWKAISLLIHLVVSFFLFWAFFSYLCLKKSKMYL